MNVCLSKRKKLARTLLRANRDGRSYRTIAKEDFCNQVDQSTLSRIARTKGAWLPKDERILIVLGLVKPKPPKQPAPPVPEWVKPIRKKIAQMAKQTRIDLGLQK